MRNPYCEKSIELVEKYTENETMICQETMGQECFSTYETRYEAVKVIKVLKTN